MFIDLSYNIYPDMPVFPGNPDEKFIPHLRIKDGKVCNSTMVHHFLHSGTHVDAPYHFDDKGRTIDQIPIEDFCYTRPLIIKKELSKGELIQPEDLKDYGMSLYKADILLICTGYYKIRDDRDAFMDDFPAFSAESAELVRKEQKNIKAIAIDSLSIESSTLGPQQDFMVHKTLLAGFNYNTRPVLIFEDVNIGAVLGKRIKRILAFPIRLTGLDAAPVAVVAEVI